MRKIAISLTKGGVGKTTTAVNLAAGLALNGHRVLLVDTDTQGQSSKSLGVRVKKGLAEILSGEALADEVLIESRPNFKILPAGESLAEAKRLIDKKSSGGEFTLAESFNIFEDTFDFVILDSSPGLDALSVNVLFYANELLTPVSLEVLSLQGLIEFQKTIESVQKYHPIENKYILPTFLDGRVKKSNEILDQLKQYFGLQVCNPIRYSVRISEAPGFGQSIFEYAPRSNGAKDYQKLVERVINDGS